MKFFIALAAAATLCSTASFAADPAAPGGKGACKADIQKFCAGIDHEKGKMHACLVQHQADLSDTCKQRMAYWAAKKAAAPAAN